MHVCACTHPRARLPTCTHAYAHTHKYVILTVFPQQQLFRERASLLRYTYIACNVYASVIWQPLDSQMLLCKCKCNDWHYASSAGGLHSHSRPSQFPLPLVLMQMATHVTRQFPLHPHVCRPGPPLSPALSGRQDFIGIVVNIVLVA